jgi:hypothetical protein
MAFPLFLALVIVLVYYFSSTRADIVLGKTVPGNVSVITTSQDAFDAPRLSAVNATSFEWWFFDAVTKDGKNSLAVVFYRMNESEVSSPVFLQVTIAYGNGTIYDQSFPVLICDCEWLGSQWCLGSGRNICGSARLVVYFI